MTMLEPFPMAALCEDPSCASPLHPDRWTVATARAWLYCEHWTGPSRLLCDNCIERAGRSIEGFSLETCDDPLRLAVVRL